MSKKIEDRQDDLLEVKAELQRLSNLVSEAKKNPGSSIEMFAVIKSLKDQILTMNEMTTTILSQANNNYARVEQKVDDNNKRLDMFQSEIRDFTTAISQLSMRIESKVIEQDKKIENIESTVGHFTGERVCETSTKKFCEEMEKEKPMIETLIEKEKNKKSDLKTIKNGLLKNIGASLVGVGIALIIILYIGSSIFFKSQIDEIKKMIPITKSKSGTP